MFRIRHLAASLVLTGGLGLAGLTLVQVDELQERRVVGAFNDAADDRLETIAQHIRAELDAVASVSAFFNASGRVERADFAAFASTLLTWSPGLQSLQWVPRVTAGERSVFEQAARDDGLTAFEFSELTTSGAIVRAADRTEHFPAYYVEPQRGNGAALGFDLGSDPARMSALVKARDSGQLTATEPLATPQGRGDTATVQLVLPVYRGGRDPLDVTQRRRQLLGFAVGVLRIDAMVAGALGGGSLGEAPGNDRAAPSASLYVFDDTSRPDGQLLHYQDPDGGVASGTILPAGGVAEAARRRPEAGANLHRTRAIAIGGRTWTIVMGSTDDTQRGITGWQPWVAMSGVLAAAMFAAFHVGAPVGRRRTAAPPMAQQIEQQDGAIGQLELAVHTTIPLQVLLQKPDTSDAVRAAIDQLPAHYSAVITMRDIEGYSTEEAAKILELTQEDVTSRLLAARAALKGSIEPIIVAQRSSKSGAPAAR